LNTFEAVPMLIILDKTKTKSKYLSFESSFLKDKELKKTIDLIIWIFENANPSDENFYMSYRQIKEKLNISEMTFFRWLKILLKKEFLKKIDTNLYKINKNFIGVSLFQNIPNIG
jgi:hypothetical protein